MDATIIVPAYNEENGLPLVLRDIASIPGSDRYEVMVINDGSTDFTTDIARKYGYRVIRHHTNMGKGAALMSGFARASCDNIVWIDADGSYPASVIPQMVDAMRSGYDGVVCSRNAGRENIPAFNRIGNWLFSVLIRSLHGFPAKDPCTGLYGMQRSILLSMGLTSERFAIEPEISIKAGRMKLKLLEIPVAYTQRLGESKLNSFSAGWDDLVAIIRYIGWRPEK